MIKRILPEDAMLGDLLSEKLKLDISMMCCDRLQAKLRETRTLRVAQGDKYRITFVLDIEIGGDEKGLVAVPVLEPV